MGEGFEPLGRLVLVGCPHWMRYADSSLGPCNNLHEEIKTEETNKCSNEQGNDERLEESERGRAGSC